jgi:hypothetical protein
VTVEPTPVEVSPARPLPYPLLGHHDEHGVEITRSEGAFPECDLPNPCRRRSLPGEFAATLGSCAVRDVWVLRAPPPGGPTLEPTGPPYGPVGFSKLRSVEKGYEPTPGIRPDDFGAY